MGKFANTAKALRVYDRRMAVLAKRMDAAENDADVFDVVEAEKVALAILQKAFYADTSDCNSWEHCQIVTASHLRELVQKST